MLPICLRGNYVFSAYYIYGVGMLLIFQGSLWDVCHEYSSLMKS